ncbi:hypothetical protein J1N10_03810, partial [Carboxylicivirga sp. A043]|uniref:hypothetical protein n=1 Tax=Carboxylicivirga litoralis TaxID=2816963 RepID=UPI0021CB5B56
HYVTISAETLTTLAFQMNRCSQKRVQNKGVFFISPNVKAKFFTAFLKRCSLGVDLMTIET